MKFILHLNGGAERRQIMLLLLLILSDWIEIRRIDREIEAIKTNQWWK